MRAALEAIGDREVRLDAQTGLLEWYASYGFVATGPAFDEDGVLHVPMARASHRSSVVEPQQEASPWPELDAVGTRPERAASAARHRTGAGQAASRAGTYELLNKLVPCDVLGVGWTSTCTGTSRTAIEVLPGTRTRVREIESDLGPCTSLHGGPFYLGYMHWNGAPARGRVV